MLQDFYKPRNVQTTGSPLVSPAASCISGLRRGERSAHVFSHPHPHCIRSLQQSCKEKCSVALMNAKLWINNFLVSLIIGITHRHCPGKFSNINIALSIADAHVYISVFEVFFYVFNIINLVTAQCFRRYFNMMKLSFMLKQDVLIESLFKCQCFC